MILKQVIHYPDTNSVEATWVERTVTPAQGVEGEEGYVAEQVTDVQVKCHSYDQVQMDMLEADLGADVSEYADLIAQVRNNQLPPPPAPPRDVKGEIASMESTQLMPRVTREFMLGLLEGQYPPEQLALNIGYTKLKAFDNEIKALRELL